MKKIRFILSIAIVFSLFQQLFADGKGFESAQFEEKETVIPYRFQHFEGKDVPCLFVFLHGNSASGTDNEKQLEKDTLLNAVSYIEKNKINAFVLAPQSPTDISWIKLSADVRTLVQDFAEKNGVAQDRILLVGESKGAAGLWFLLNRYPGFARKAVALASAPKDVKTENLLKTGIYGIVGDKDTVGSKKGQKLEGSVTPKIRDTKSVIEALQKKNGDAHMKILKGADHYETCRIGLSDDVLDWLFSE